MDCLAEDVAAFGANAEFSRRAVTMEQARQYNLPSKPQKETDKRGEKMAETWQAEALDPPVLAAVVDAALTELIGTDAVALTERRTEQERAEILDKVKKIREDT
jgi:hypothetical protein